MERLPMLMVDRIEIVKISILLKGNTYSRSSGNQPYERECRKGVRDREEGEHQENQDL